jgi:hypothetical protein
MCKELTAGRLFSPGTPVSFEINMPKIIDYILEKTKANKYDFLKFVKKRM